MKGLFWLRVQVHHGREVKEQELEVTAHITAVRTWRGRKASVLALSSLSLLSTESSAEGDGAAHSEDESSTLVNTIEILSHRQVCFLSDSRFY